MWLEYGEIFTTLSTDASIRCIILSGKGTRAFTAGLDIQHASVISAPPETDPGRRGFSIKNFLSNFQTCIGTAERCAKPVICVLHGISYGLAIDIAACADIRLCASNARFAIKEVDIGIAADIGTLTRLPKIVGNLSWVKDVAFTGREFGAIEARDVGFVSMVLEDKDSAVEEALKIAKVIAEKSPVAIQGTKKIVNFSIDHNISDGELFCAIDGNPFADRNIGLEFTQIWNAFALQAPDPATAINSVISKKKPTFSKL
jgi:delta(3,5)-delta(2,4)-dienoyl-CoA isomerase